MNIPKPAQRPRVSPKNNPQLLEWHAVTRRIFRRSKNTVQCQIGNPAEINTRCSILSDFPTGQKHGAKSRRIFRRSKNTVQRHVEFSDGISSWCGATSGFPTKISIWGHIHQKTNLGTMIDTYMNL